MNKMMFVVAGILRRLWALVVWRLAVLMWCRRLRIEGIAGVLHRPMVIVANHASHADTVLLQYALATCHDQPVLVAGAEDYWFRNVVMGAGARFLGVFAFPRNGEAGVRRTGRALDRQASVVLFPQGSRSGGRFRSGIGRIAEQTGVDVLPVHLAGVNHLLPKGQRWPRRSDVVVRFGVPTTICSGETAEEFATRLERTVLIDLAGAA